MKFFALVPESIIQRNDGETLRVYTNLYLKEFQNKEYNLAKIARESTLTYRQCRSLQKLARQIVEGTRKGKSHE